MIHALFSLWPFAVMMAVACGLSWLLTDLVRKKLLAKAVMDVPNERSMHKTPVPRGGGLAVVQIILVGMALSYLFVPSNSLPLLTSVFLLLFVSWLDDKKGLGVGPRLGAHLLAALIGSYALGDEAHAFGDFLPFWLDRAALILGWVWFMNLTNFMDGIDGITGVQTITTTLGAGALLWLTDNLFLKTGLTGPDMALAAIMAGACAGFLIHNWHPAKIFLGDAGSVPLGFLMGYLLLKLAAGGFWAPALILPLYYLADSGLTIGHRALKREKIWKPHRQHFYQRAAVGEGRHDKIVLWVLETNLLLILLAGASVFYPPAALAAAVLTVALLLSKMHKSAQKVSS